MQRLASGYVTKLWKTAHRNRCMTYFLYVLITLIEKVIFQFANCRFFFGEIFHITSITRGYPKIFRRFGINIGHFVSPIFD
jgi:hypothetical protein